jgi:hypothetical protein
MDAMFPGIVLLFFQFGGGGGLSIFIVVLRFFVEPDSLAFEDPSLSGFLDELPKVLLRFGLFVVEGRCKVHLDIGLYYADGIEVILGLYLQDVDLELAREGGDGDRVALV